MSQNRNRPSPKQPQPERHRDWYPYYAGFTEAFVEDVLLRHASTANSVVDPWNGSGTTTAACAKHGVAATGVDINPALTIIARARLTPKSVADSLQPLAAKLVSAVEPCSSEARESDLLTLWLRPSAASEVRAIQGAIHTALTDLAFSTRDLSLTQLAERLPLLACFYYSALFASTRDILCEFRSTNPTWIREPPTYRHRLAPTPLQIQKAFILRVAYLAERLTVATEELPEPLAEIRTGSANELPFSDGSFDAAVSSPPYATRIDYVKSVLPELAVLGASHDDISSLRRVTTGSPVVKNFATVATELHSDSARELLGRIWDHKSKGSRSYYHPWMNNYFRSLQAGLLETARVVKPGGSISIVVQDSHYKELRVALQRIVVETLNSTGRSLIMRRDFPIKHHRARMNPKALLYLKARRNAESLLVFS